MATTSELLHLLVERSLSAALNAGVVLAVQECSAVWWPWVVQAITGGIDNALLSLTFCSWRSEVGFRCSGRVEGLSLVYWP